VAGRFDVQTNIKDQATFDVEAEIRPEWFVERPQNVKIVDGVRDFVRDGLRNHLIVIGTRGSGKTHTVRYKLREVRDYLYASHPEWLFDEIYLNCMGRGTSYKLIKALVGQNVADRRNGVMEAFQSFAQVCETAPRPIVLVLDEVDALTDFLFFYYVLRDAAYRRLLLICITKTPKFFQRLPNDVTTALHREFVHFDTYNQPQLRAILTKRAQAGFVTYDDRVLGKLAAANARYAHGDARAGIRLLEKLFRAPPPSPEGYVWPSDVEKMLETSIQDEYLNVKANTIYHLDEQKLAILHYCLKMRQSNLAYEAYAREVQSPLSKAWFLHMVDELVYMDLLSASRATGRRILHYGELIGERNVALVTKLVDDCALIKKVHGGGDDQPPGQPPDEETMLVEE